VTEKKGGSARRALQRGSRRAQPAGETKRITVDLPRSEHKFLRDFAYDNDTDGMRVVRALLLELRDDPGLSPRVLARMGEL
jgi:hypothetical protein